MPKTQSQRILLLKKNYTIWSIVFQNNFWRTNYFNSNMCTKSALYIVIKCEKNRVWKKNVLISRCAVENGKSSQKGAKQILCILKRSSKELGARLFWPNCAQNRPFTQWSKIKNSISKLLVQNQEFFLKSIIKSWTGWFVVK